MNEEKNESSSHNKNTAALLEAFNSIIVEKSIANTQYKHMQT